MVLRRVLAICLLALPAFSSGPVLADLADQQPSYTRIAAKCGADPSQPAFSASEYAEALGAAAKALKQAVKDGNKGRQTAITEQMAQVKDCMEQERNHYHIPPIRTCDEFTDHYFSVKAWSAKALAEGRITKDYQDRLYFLLRGPAEQCVRKLMATCIDPTSASAVNDALRAMEAAAAFGFLMVGEDSALDQLKSRFGGGRLRLRFCTDTDYACSGEINACLFKIDKIKAMMRAFLEP